MKESNLIAIRAKNLLITDLYREADSSYFAKSSLHLPSSLQSSSA